MRSASLVLGLALIAAAAAAQAEDLDARWYVTPSLSYTFTDNDRAADNGLGYGLALGKVLHEYLNLELGAHYESLDFDLGDELELKSLGLDALFFFDRNPRFSPFALIGAGAIRTELPVGVMADADDESLMADAGIGFLTRLSDRIDLRAEGRYRWDENHTDLFAEKFFGDWLASVGLSIKLGDRESAPKPPPIPAPSPALAPEPGPPPAPRPIPQPMPTPVDSDGDGVTDDRDACPGTPADARVDARGCELDSDGDGVVDRLDQCPGTATGDKVDTKGCTLPLVTLRGVNFDNDKSTLRPDAIAILDEAVATLKSHPELKVEVAGHTDSNASEPYNQQLSERRTRAVVDYLVAHGIASSRLTAKGYGEAQPVANNASEEGRFQNRRVELLVLR